MLDQVTKRFPDLPAPRATRGVCRARVGQRDAAHQDANFALRLAGNSGEIVYQAARIHALTSRSHAGDRQEAFRLVTLALRLGFGHDRLTKEPDLKPLRADPRFRQLVAAVQTFQAR